MTLTQPTGLTQEFAARLMVLDKLFEIAADRGLARAADDLLMLPKDLSNQQHFDNLHAYKQKVNDLVSKYRGKCSPQALTEFGNKILKVGMDFVQACMENPPAQ